MPLYRLAVIGVLSVGAVISYQQRTSVEAVEATAVERPTIDEAVVIGSVMADNYGKYSDARRGWLYVADNDRTYLMRVALPGLARLRSDRLRAQPRDAPGDRRGRHARQRDDRACTRSQRPGRGRRSETQEPAANEVEGPVGTDPDDYFLCQKRRWTYRTGTVKGGIPVPITVTAGGTVDGQPVPTQSWKLVFDSKGFRYNVPDDLKGDD